MINWGNPAYMRWNSEYMEVRWNIDDNGRDILCRVSQEAIEDNCDTPRTEDACLDAAREHFDHIVDRIELKMAHGSYEDDGSILLRSRDW